MIPVTRTRWDLLWFGDSGLLSDHYDLGVFIHRWLYRKVQVIVQSSDDVTYQVIT